MTDIKWTPLRYPCGDPENGPARQNPVDGCIRCKVKEAEHYNSDGMCDICQIDDVYSNLENDIRYAIQCLADMGNGTWDDVVEEVMDHINNMDLSEPDRPTPQSMDRHDRVDAEIMEDIARMRVRGISMKDIVLTDLWGYEFVVDSILERGSDARARPVSTRKDP